MPLRNTIFIPNGYYHIYNRGSEKRTIFLCEKDYKNFLERVRKNIIKYDLDILAYCLMPNHFHFLVHQNNEDAIRNTFTSIQLGHAKYFNTKYERVGPLFQGRFKAKMVESDEYLLQLSSYIHRNAPDSGNTKDSRNLLLSYPYSSYRAYILKKPSFVKTETILGYFSKTFPKLTYQAFVEGFEPDVERLSPWIYDLE